MSRTYLLYTSVTESNQGKADCVSLQSDRRKMDQDSTQTNS